MHRCLVSLVQEGGAGAAGGVRVGDWVVAVDGADVSARGSAFVQQLVAPLGSITLVLRRESEVEPEPEVDAEMGAEVEPEPEAKVDLGAAYAWRDGGLEFDQRVLAMRRRRAHLLTIDLAGDAEAREEFLSLIPALDQALRRVLLSSADSAPPAVRPRAHTVAAVPVPEVPHEAALVPEEPQEAAPAEEPALASENAALRDALLQLRGRIKTERLA